MSGSMRAAVNALRSIHLISASVLTLLASAACGGSTVTGSSVGPALDRLLIDVAGPAESHSSRECFLLIDSKVVGGGTMSYCLQTFRGRPGPDVVVKSTGTVTFALPRGQIRGNVDVEQKVASDGKHAVQKLSGSVTRGTGAYHGFIGTISGGGSNEEYPAGTITDSNLHYLVRFGS